MTAVAGERLEHSHEQLRNSDYRFRQVFEHSNDAIFIMDPERDEILDCNSKACRLLGYSRYELLTTPVSAIHPKEMPELLAFARSVREQGRGWTDELTCLTKAGDAVPAEISASVFDMHSRTCMIACVRDITDRKRTEARLQRYTEELEGLVEERTAQLRRSEERQRVLLEINNAIITNLDKASLFHAVSQALRQVLPFDVAGICLHDPRRDSFRLFALERPSLAKQSFEVGTEFPRQGTHVGWVFDERKFLLRRDLEHEQQQFPVEESLLASGIRSYIVAPLIAKGTVFGTLHVGSKATNRFSEEDGEFLEEVAMQVALAVENTVAYEEIAELKARLERENLYLQEEIKTQHNFEEIVGQSRAIREVFKAVETVAPTDTTVLITGETGTGKELVARALHELSTRREKTLMKVNCAAMPAGLIESELFGHERGAFTGAISRRVGRFEMADGGTLFLDEIGDLPPELQAKLLRVLQEGEFERVGGSSTIRVDVRVVAATNRDLEKALAEGTFRSDLYYRLKVFPIRLPSLRERREDIPLLVTYFAGKYGARMQKRIETVPQTAMVTLRAYSWPGNVRELENVIERAVILSRGAELELREWLPKRGGDPPRTRLQTLDELQRDYISQVLELTGSRVRGPGGAAAFLGIKPTTLEARMKKLGIERKE